MYLSGVKDRKWFYEVNYIVFFVNVKVIEFFREYVFDGKIGLSFVYFLVYFLFSYLEDILVFENVEEFMNNWWLDMYCWGIYL